jgi:hypothetical protein
MKVAFLAAVLLLAAAVNAQESAAAVPSVAPSASPSLEDTRIMVSATAFADAHAILGNGRPLEPLCHRVLHATALRWCAQSGRSPVNVSYMFSRYEHPASHAVAPSSVRLSALSWRCILRLQTCAKHVSNHPLMLQQ